MRDMGLLMSPGWRGAVTKSPVCSDQFLILLCEGCVGSSNFSISGCGCCSQNTGLVVEVKSAGTGGRWMLGQDPVPSLGWCQFSFSCLTAGCEGRQRRSLVFIGRGNTESCLGRQMWLHRLMVPRADGCSCPECQAPVRIPAAWLCSEHHCEEQEQGRKASFTAS